MIAFTAFGNGFDHAQSLNEQISSNAKAAVEQFLTSGQEIQAQFANQAAAARNRLITCLDELARSPDAAAASQVGAHFFTASMRDMGENLTQWSQLLMRGFDAPIPAPAQAE
ncbi:hypothetical protein WBP07_30875 [Novosphingobium sp. BL-8A]|uniref:hypothetical protein n=1 Tax=Novosphingobium sp. BL-8A TaxID=3127639 RepID=UPI003756B97C